MSYPVSHSSSSAPAGGAPSIATTEGLPTTSPTVAHHHHHHHLHQYGSNNSTSTMPQGAALYASSAAHHTHQTPSGAQGNLSAHHQHHQQQQQPYQLAQSARQNATYAPVRSVSDRASPSPPASSHGNSSTQKNPRLSRACDMCSQRKVKCDDLTPSCRPCQELGVQCTRTRPQKRRGPPNKHAEAAKAADKRQKTDPTAPSTVNPAPPSQNAAQTLVSLGVGSVQSAEVIAPWPVLTLLVDDFYTYIHPLIPFPHEPTFRKSFLAREDKTDPEFLALLASMIGALVASFPRTARLHLKASHSYQEYPRSIVLVEKCEQIALASRSHRFMSKELVTVRDAATSYFIGLSAGYTMQRSKCVRFLQESLGFVREMGFHRKRPSPTSVSTGTDFITEEIGKRIFWTLFLGVRSISQLEASNRDLIIIPPETKEDKYPDYPRQVDDACISLDTILPQPEGTTSNMTGFVACANIYKTSDDLVRLELTYGIGSYSWEEQRHYLREALQNIKKVIDQLPYQLQLDMNTRSTAGLGAFGQGGPNGSSAYQYVPPAYPEMQPNHDVRHLIQSDSSQKRHLQSEIQKTNIYASWLATRSYYVEMYFDLRDTYLRKRRQSQAATGNIVYRTADTSSSLAAAAMQAVADQTTYDSIDELFHQEREMIVQNLFTVLISIPQQNMEPNGSSLINKIRQVASTLLNDPLDRKGPYARQNEEYLKSFLQILTRLEKTSSINRPSPSAVVDDTRGLSGPRGSAAAAAAAAATVTMTTQDEEEELGNWADLREKQEQFFRLHGAYGVQPAQEQAPM